MAGFSELELIRIAAKALAAGVKDADPRTQWYESVTANAFVLGGDKVWTSPDVDSLRDNPAANLSQARTLASGPLAGIVEDLSQPADAVQLSAVPGINNTYVALNTPGDFSSGVLDNWVLPQFVPQANGLPSFGYAVRLFDGDPNSGGTEVFTTDGATGTGINKTVSWIFDYATGILLLSDTQNLFSNDPYINGFVYTGTTANAATTSSGTQPFIEYEANCPSSTAVDDFVYITGPSSSGKLQVATVDITDRSTMPAFGVVIDKITTTLCKVRVSGEFVPADSLTPGKRYFISSNGQVVDSLPSASPGGQAVVQSAAYAIDTNRLLLTLDQIPIVRTGS